MSMSLTIDEYVTRRQRLFAQMPANSVAVFFAGHEQTRSNDTEYLFCQDKTFLYMTGYPEPDAVLVMIKAETNESILFCRQKDSLQEVWHGRRIGVDNAIKDYQFDQAYELTELTTKLEELLADKTAVWSCSGQITAENNHIALALANIRAKARSGIKAPTTQFDCQAIIDEMRLIKSPAELAVMRKVNQISGGAHVRAMEKAQPGLYEYQLEAELLHEFARHGARHAAYNCIVACGDNANILHYTDCSDRLEQGQLILIDAGGELNGYAADITRTFPVSGTFSAPQKQLYELVHSALEQTVAMVKPGICFAELNDKACEILTQGLLELGILSGDYQTLLSEKACKKYFIHSLGHWLGLDVHDVGNYQVKDKRQTRLFEPGMVLTIEPGLYIPLDDDSVEEKWRGIGIRIEDNIVVTDLGHENLSESVPKSVEDIEQLMRNAQR
ncbi:Xaa-Pro aminopeptidase [Thalassotalea ganghwensis]